MLMSQYAEEIIIAYDSDGAGQNATHKAINLLSEAGVSELLTYFGPSPSIVRPPKAMTFPRKSIIGNITRSWL